METVIAEIITENISLNVCLKHYESGICFSSVYIKKVILETWTRYTIQHYYCQILEKLLKSALMYFLNSEFQELSSRYTHFLEIQK